MQGCLFSFSRVMALFGVPKGRARLLKGGRMFLSFFFSFHDISHITSLFFTLNTHTFYTLAITMPTKKVVKGSKNTSATLDVEAALSNPAMFHNNALATANTQKQRAETLMEIQIRCG